MGVEQEKIKTGTDWPTCLESGCFPVQGAKIVTRLRRQGADFLWFAKAIFVNACWINDLVAIYA